MSGTQPPHLEPPEDRRCTARSSRTGERCRLWAMRGSTVCGSHGGRARQVRAAAKRRLEAAEAEATVAAMVDKLNLGPKHPLDSILESLDRAGAMVGVLGVLVGGLPANGEGLYGPDHLGDARPHVLVTLYRDWIGEYGKQAKAALDVGLDAKRVHLVEMQARNIGDIIDAALTAAGLTLAQQEAFRYAFVDRLALVESGAAAS